MALVTFTDKDFKQLIDWISCDELNYLWAGPTYSYPLTVQQITTHCDQPEVFPFLFQVSGRNAGFIELYRVADDHYRICRVFIANEYRGHGLSKQMMANIIVKAQVKFNCKLLSLAVFEHNIVAKNCYLALGFDVVDTEIGTRVYKEKSWNLVRMQKQLLGQP
ncbi:N-acetyltransferase [Psychromonas marina]|uniref:N-acetyltransferase n=1 Tax=Psychromonas marina TaxID=88364 RepID=A0ABQ6E3M9_9GAMM|nr:GNAT family N-acetyltransferase [Psychromonas marina]GLS92059.1 N-acetyltransferase [Psychromonas marina]